MRRRLKVKHHAAEAGGVGERCCVRRRLKVKHHSAEAGGVQEFLRSNYVLRRHENAQTRKKERLRGAAPLRTKQPCPGFTS